MASGYQRQSARAAADRGRCRAREVDRSQDRHSGDGGRDPEGGQVALRAENDIRCEIDAKTGETRLVAGRDGRRDRRERQHADQSGEDAQGASPTLQIGDKFVEQLPPLDFGRVAAQNAKQVIVQKVRDAERERQYGEYKDRIGEIANGTVKRVEYGNVIVDLGRAEGIIRRDEMIPRENVRYGDRIRAYIYDVRREQRGPQIFLSRARPEFMSKLFAMEVPEIYDGIVEIKSVARDPGSRAKIAVISKDSSIDPVGACVGMRGQRVQAVVDELQGEKVDIIQWKADAAEFIVNALAPAEVTKVVLDEDSNRIEVVVPEKPAVARHRPARPERAAGLAAHRLGHRHPDRGRRRASGGRRSSPSARRCSWIRSTSTR